MSHTATMKRPHDEALGDSQSEDDQAETLFIEDEIDKVPPYDSKKEPLPNCKLYTAEFKFIQDGKAKISDLLDTPFKQSTFKSGTTEGLQEDLKRRVQDQTSDKIKVGVVGDMSSGMACLKDHSSTSLTRGRQKLCHQLAPQRGCHCTSGKCTTKLKLKQST